MSDRVEHTHESYGLLGVTHVNGGNNTLFGSNIKHSETVRLTIRRASVERDIHRSWYREGEELIEVEMSLLQWAEAVTKTNCGVGVPCTLRLVNHQDMAPCPQEDERERVRSEFSDKMADVVRRFDADMEVIATILAKPAVNKGDRKTITEAVERIRRELGANVPYVTKCFEEATEETLAHAKRELESLVSMFHNPGPPRLGDGGGDGEE